MAAVEFSDVRKSFGNDEVLHGINLRVEPGEFLIVVGPSGCGKTSLLRLLAGLEEITAGTIQIDGRTVNRLEPREREIAMVFQNYALYPHMSVYKNMAYGLRIQRLPKTEIRERIHRAADILQLDHAMLGRRPGQLSGGQRQRVAMGRAIVRKPKVFLFDEPLSNLDAKLRVQMRVEIKRLHQLLGVTTLYVTHDQVEAMTLGQRLVVMNAGRVEQIGPPPLLYDQPTTRFVAGFIGSPTMNFMPGVIDGQGETVTVAGDVRLPLGTSRPYAAGRSVEIGIRPEHLAAGNTGDAPFQLTVELVEDLGADSLIHAYNDHRAMVCRVTGHTAISAGDPISVTVPNPDDIHVFDAENEQRLDPEASRQEDRVERCAINR